MRGADGRLLPPEGGHPPPTDVLLSDGVSVPLVPLAQEICRRYREEFPDEQVRYGDAGIAWCVHDNQHLLDWAAGSLHGWVRMEHQVGWLADVLEARGFPLDRLARNLDIGAQVVRANVVGDHGPQWANALATSAELIRRRVRSPPAV